MGRPSEMYSTSFVPTSAANFAISRWYCYCQITVCAAPSVNVVCLDLLLGATRTRFFFFNTSTGYETPHSTGAGNERCWYSPVHKTRKKNVYLFRSDRYHGLLLDRMAWTTWHFTFPNDLPSNIAEVILTRVALE